MKKPNTDIEVALLNAGIRKYQVADALGMTDANFSRILRKEFTPEKKAEIIQIIGRMAKET